MSKDNKEKLNEMFENLEDESTVGILVHPFPDPDCLGAAAGFAVLLQNVYKLNSKIYHLGEISHPQNRSIKNVLHITLSDGRDFDSASVSAVVVLDTDLKGTGIGVGKFEKTYVRIDHHTFNKTNGVGFSDIRVIGSTCAIVWEYLQMFKISLEEHPDVATAMVLGIKTDTLDFTTINTSDLDIEAYRSLLSFVDKTLLAKVIKYSLPKILFEIEAKAYKSKEIRNTSLISFIGDVSPHNRDIIPTIADRFSRIDGVNTAVIIGVIENNIIASIRSDDTKVDVNDICSAFGKDSGGKEGSGGVRLNLGAAYELLGDKDIKEKVRNEVVSQLKEKVFEALGELKEEV
ncbi:hypothetical protein LCGC14_1292330 [marine sediment metagenome]|uniref:DDH domain-containing protein n=1 Tax=marine sediment metagenome TaxID=412755 RepID=A0A0F9KS83_9ZZZZ